MDSLSNKLSRLRLGMNLINLLGQPKHDGLAISCETSTGNVVMFSLVLPNKKGLANAKVVGSLGWSDQRDCGVQY